MHEIVRDGCLTYVGLPIMGKQQAWQAYLQTMLWELSQAIRQRLAYDPQQVEGRPALGPPSWLCSTSALSTHQALCSLSRHAAQGSSSLGW
jgi:hypothetical protein